MRGIVLCGGQSTRMGTDKGLLSLDEKVWAEIVREKLTHLRIPSAISINTHQKENYLKHFDANDLVVDNPGINIQGPVLGLMSAHLKFPSDDLLVLACDMIAMHEEVLRKLTADHDALNPSAIAYKSDRIEPMCAIFSSQGLNKILHAHQRGGLPKNSMTYVLSQLNAVYISLPEEWRPYFKNVNSAKDN
jgi:molybdopterin-guanine dinucleotide biosynthesis protein A